MRLKLCYTFRLQRVSTPSFHFNSLFTSTIRFWHTSARTHTYVARNVCMCIFLLDFITFVKTHNFIPLVVCWLAVVVAQLVCCRTICFCTSSRDSSNNISHRFWGHFPFTSILYNPFLHIFSVVLCALAELYSTRF